MRKLLLLLLALVMLLSMAACGEDTIPSGSEGTTEENPSLESTKPEHRPGYALTYKEIKLEPGTVFDPSKLPEPEYTYTQPNCAIEGNDTVYNYGEIEIAVYDDGKEAIIQVIYIDDPNLPTPEGLMLGDDLSKVTQLYGTEYVENGAEWQFIQGDTILAILTQDDFVASIQYRLAV